MNGPIRRRGQWWQADSSGTWNLWNKENRKWEKTSDSLLPPPRFGFFSGGDAEPNPFLLYAMGIASLLVALLITASLVSEASVASVLAPVTAVIGTFTGHAAGHSSAMRARGR
jgi:hypothetical protein